LKPGVEGIGCGLEDGDIVNGILGDNVDFHQAGRCFGQAQQDLRLACRGRLAAVAELVENMCGSQKIALVVDEESVAVKDVMEAAVGGSLVELIDDGADGSEKGGVVVRGLVLGRSGLRGSREQ